MDSIVPFLLLPEHVKLSSSNLPLLKGIQTVLNESYTATYCAHPELFGTSHVRIADPAQVADIIGTEGFTVVLVRVTPSDANETPPVWEVVATGSVKDFGDGDIDTYVQWSKNLSGSQWAAKAGNQEDSGVTPAETSKEGSQKLELTAFGVSPHCQSNGLGARLLDEIKWLVTDGRVRDITADSAMAEGQESLGSASTFPLEGINLNQLKSVVANGETSKSPQAIEKSFQPKLVLVAIRELGNETYYCKRGFRTLWSGTVPVGTWDCKKECTMVYMEMDLN